MKSFILLALLQNLPLNSMDLKIFPELSNRYCKISAGGTPLIKILTDKPSRAIELKIMPGQTVKPLDPEKPSIFQNNFIYIVELSDLTDESIPGKVAFETAYVGAGMFAPHNAVIFDNQNPFGISRRKFLDKLPQEKHHLANLGLNNFLRLFPLFAAAIDSCRPIRVVTYATTEETDRIESGRKRYFQMAKEFNQKKQAPVFLERLGNDGGFYDPDSTIEKYGVKINFEYLNPLIPIREKNLNKDQCAQIISLAMQSPQAPREKMRLAEFLYKETLGRCPLESLSF